MSESRSGWSPDGTYHAVTERVATGVRWAVIHATAKAACGARCLPHPTSWPQLSSECRRCPTCMELVAEGAAPGEAGEADEAGERWTVSEDLRAELAQQLEELLGSVWACEADWDLYDRIDRSIRYGR